jgi:Fusaric acid resistance protein family
MERDPNDAAEQASSCDRPLGSCGRRRALAGGRAELLTLLPAAWAMSLPAWRDRAFAFKIAAAALLALFLALWIDLPRPYWAVSTVFITMQPARPARRPSIRFWIAWPLVLS